MDGLQRSLLKVATATKVVVAGERPDPGASSHHRHDAGAPSVGACRTRSADTRSILRVCLRNSCARALGILSIVIVVVVMEDEVLFLRWLLLFHLRLIGECDVEVLVAPSFRCDARVFPPLHRHAESTRRFVVMRRRSSSALSRHSAKNCLACCLMLCCKVSYHSFRGAFHDELGQDGACHGHGRRDRADEAHPVHLASNGGSIVCRICASCHVARPLSKVGCINTAALPSQNGNEHIASISRFMAFPSCCHPAIVAVSAIIQASGAAVPRAWPPSRTRPVCTARPRLASRRVSSSGLATDSSPAGLPHCAAEILGGSSNFQTRALKTIHVARLSLFARTRAWL